MPFPSFLSFLRRILSLSVYLSCAIGLLARAQYNNNLTWQLSIPFRTPSLRSSQPQERARTFTFSLACHDPHCLLTPSGPIKMSTRGTSRVVSTPDPGGLAVTPLLIKLEYFQTYLPTSNRPYQPQFNAQAMQCDPRQIANVSTGTLSVALLCPLSSY